MAFQRRRDRPFIRAVLFVVAALALPIGIRQLTTTAHLLRHAVRTTGYAVARRGDPAATESGAHPDIEFRDGNGRPIHYNQNGMGSRRVGTPIPVLYDPADPAGTAVADTFWQIWPDVLFPFWIAIGFSSGALWGEVSTNWDRRREPAHTKA